MINRFKTSFLQESNNVIHFKINCLMMVSDRSPFDKSDLLNNIRAITGVTRVHIEETIEKNNGYVSKMHLKINLNAFESKNLQQCLNFIRKECLSIKGIQRFTYISTPERISI